MTQSRDHRVRGLVVPSGSDDLFATIYEQTQRVLAKTCGFYILTYDGERDVSRLAYFVDDDRARVAGTSFDGPACEAIRERRTVTNHEFAKRLSADVVNSIAVPMMRNDIVLGSIGVFSRRARQFDQPQAMALEAIAQLGALALENARFFAVIEKARHEAERLEEIGRAISASLDLSEVLNRVVNAAVDLLDADGATVWLMRGETEVEVAMTAGDVSPPQGLVIPVPEHIRRRMSDPRKPYLLFEDIKGGDHDLPLHLRNLTNAASTMAVALIADEQMLGAISIANADRVRYGASDIRLLERISFQAAIAVANARLHEQIRALSLTDPLTSMPNRRHLGIFLEKEFAAARRGRKLSVLLFDLDNFKTYNDRHGHQAGDAILRAFAATLNDQTRAMNLAARYGGDEFIAVLADTDLTGAEAHAERLLHEISADAVLAAAGVHASIGIATYDADMASFEDLIRAADRDLYLRKKAGRESA